MPEFDFTDYGPVYRDIPGFPGYRIGTDGSIWSAWKHLGSTAVVIGPVWKLRKLGITPKGYSIATLSKDGKQKSYAIAPLVLSIFVGPRPDGTEVAHENGIRNDNRLCNLSWKTHKANEADKVRHGTLKFGETHPCAKLSPADIEEAKRLRAAGLFYREIGARLGISGGHARSIVKGITWKRARAG